jgi:hypothetical protein
MKTIQILFVWHLCYYPSILFQHNMEITVMGGGGNGYGNGRNNQMSQMPQGSEPRPT